jgi:transcriptional regulator with PAS, ATPase and Fis domain
LYRLHVIPLTVPPLRQRKDDLPLLIEHFLYTRPQDEWPCRDAPHPLTNPVFTRIYAYNWPGNVRELFNVLSRYIHTGSLEFLNLHGDAPAPRSTPDAESDSTLPGAVDAFERHLLAQALERHNWNRTRTARTLGITVRTLQRKMKKHRILPPENRLKF